MSMSPDDIFARIREVLEEALGVDEDEVTPEAKLVSDLGAESIDFLDIQFRLEKTFSTDERPFKIEQGELFPENLMDNPDWVQNDAFTDAGMAMLRERMGHLDLDAFDADRSLSGIADLITVHSLVLFVQGKLNSETTAA
tara:strand:+ start:337 stop:756 length:420 start_codon:yes stop_codon:yes gene_type:complete